MTHTSVEHQPAHLNEHSSDTGQSELPHLLQVYTEPNEGGEVIATADTGDIQNSMQGKIVIVEGEFDKLACNQVTLSLTLLTKFYSVTPASTADRLNAAQFPPYLILSFSCWSCWIKKAECCAGRVVERGECARRCLW